MIETVELVAQLNEHWRVVALVPAGQRRAWSLERLAGDAWQGQGFIRSAKMLRWSLPLCGPIDEAAAAILAALPDRVDFDATISPAERYQAALAKRRKVRAVENLETRRGSTTAQPAAPLPRVRMVAGVCIICATDFTYPAQHARTLTCSAWCSEARTRQRAARKAAEIGKAAPVPQAPGEAVRAPAEVGDKAPANVAHAIGEAETREDDGSAIDAAIDADVKAYWWENHRVRL